MPLMPKRVKHRKVSKGSRKGFATSGDKLAYGEFGIKALGRGWVTNTQIEACRVAINRHMKRKGKLWVRIFPDKPVTKKPIEVRVLFEVGGIPESLARECLRLADTKLGIRTQLVSR